MGFPQSREHRCEPNTKPAVEPGDVQRGPAHAVALFCQRGVLLEQQAQQPPHRLVLDTTELLLFVAVRPSGDLCELDVVDRLLDPNVHEAFDRLKEQGKVRFLGVSTHTPNLEEVANAAITSDRFDVMMLAYHFGAWPRLSDIIDRAAAKDIGIVGMKVLRGSQHHFIDWSPDERDSFTQASFKWVLSNPSVSCLVISLWETGQLDEFLYASGGALRPQDVAVLERYNELTTDSYCRPHCGACLDGCVEDLPIHEVLRHRMYFENFGAQKEAMRLYGELPKNASVCTECSAPCATSCPFELNVPERMRGAHALLSMS